MIFKKVFSLAALVGYMLLAASPSPLSPEQKVNSEQQKQPEVLKPAFEVEVIVTNIDVVVTDKEGRKVTGLKPENFEIYEDGLLQKVTNFYEVKGMEIYISPLDKESGKFLTPSRLSTEQSLSPGNKIIIFFDNWQLHPLNRNWSIKKLEAFIHNNFSADKANQGMVICLSQKLETLQDFTSSPAALLQALDEAKGRAGQALLHQRTQEELRKELNRMASETTRDNKFENYERAMDYAKNYVEAEQNDLFYSLKSLNALVDYLAGIEGKKVLIYVSDGLPLNPGEEVFAFLDQAFSLGKAQSEAMSYDATRVFKELTARCNANEISIYPINARGLESLVLGADKESGWNSYSRGSGMVKPGTRTRDEALKLMADETGGLAILNTNDIESGLKKIEDDLHYHYSLGYISPHRYDSAYHSIQIKLAGVKENYEVRVRYGYLRLSPEEKIKESVYSRLFLERAYNPAEIIARIMPVEKVPETDNLRLNIKLLIPIKKIALLEGVEAYGGQIKVFVALKDAAGNISPCYELSQEIKIPKKDYGLAQKSYYPYIAEMFVKPEYYTISLAVRDVLGGTTNYLQLESEVR